MYERDIQSLLCGPCTLKFGECSIVLQVWEPYIPHVKNLRRATFLFITVGGSVVEILTYLQTSTLYRDCFWWVYSRFAGDMQNVISRANRYDFMHVCVYEGMNIGM